MVAILHVILKRMKKLGLKEDYQNRDDTKDYIRCILGLPLLLAAHTGFESDGNAKERRSRSFFIERERRSVFFLYSPIVNCNFPWKSGPSVIKLIRLLPAFMHVCLLRP